MRLVAKGCGRDFLFWSHLKPKSIKAYREQLRVFVTWCNARGVDVLRLGDKERVDLLFNRYVHQRFRRFAGLQRTYVQHAFSALITERPELKSFLPRSAKALASWKKIVPSKQYPPLPYEILLVFAWEAQRQGNFAVMVAFLVAWGAYLRVSEVCALCWEDVVFGMRSSVVLAVQDSKGGRGDTQNTVLYGAKIRRLLRRWKESNPNPRPRGSVFRLSSTQLNGFISGCVVKYGLKDCGFVFHSIRHGKASFDLGRKLSVETIVVRGRWGSVKSARRYFQAGQVILTANAHRCRGVMALGRILRRGDFDRLFALG
jgi:integrase